MTWLTFVGFSIKVIGEIFLGLGVYFLHQRIAKEKKIDRHIIAEFHKEKILALTGIIFIIIGYLLEVPSKLG